MIFYIVNVSNHFKENSVFLILYVVLDIAFATGATFILNDIYLTVFEFITSIFNFFSDAIFYIIERLALISYIKNRYLIKSNCSFYL